MAESKITHRIHGFTASGKIEMTFPFTCPSDGYIKIYGSGTASYTGSITVDGEQVLAFTGDIYTGLVPVRKGQVIQAYNMANMWWKIFYPVKG